VAKQAKITLTFGHRVAVHALWARTPETADLIAANCIPSAWRTGQVAFVHVHTSAVSIAGEAFATLTRVVARIVDTFGVDAASTRLQTFVDICGRRRPIVSDDEAILQLYENDGSGTWKRCKRCNTIRERFRIFLPCKMANGD
jgi:hypothetical protein